MKAKRHRPAARPRWSGLVVACALLLLDAGRGGSAATAGPLIDRVEEEYRRAGEALEALRDGRAGKRKAG